MENKNYFFIIALLGFCACNYQTNKNNTTNSTTTVKETNIVINDWQKDENGCLKLRNENLAVELIRNNNLDGADEKKFRTVFGSPNKEDYRDGNKELVYYFDCLCIDGKSVENSDKCYASFLFVKDKLRSKDFMCE